MLRQNNATVEPVLIDHECLRVVVRQRDNLSLCLLPLPLEGQIEDDGIIAQEEFMYSELRS